MIRLLRLGSCSSPMVVQCNLAIDDPSSLPAQTSKVVQWNDCCPLLHGPSHSTWGGKKGPRNKISLFHLLFREPRTLKMHSPDPCLSARPIVRLDRASPSVPACRTFVTHDKFGYRAGFRCRLLACTYSRATRGPLLLFDNLPTSHSHLPDSAWPLLLIHEQFFFSFSFPTRDGSRIFTSN